MGFRLTNGIFKQIKTMQINPFSPLLKEFLKYLGWILLIIFISFHGCSNDGDEVEIIEVTVPEVKGTFKAQKPTNTPIGQKTAKGKTIYIENEIDPQLLAENEKLKQDFAKANDSIKKLQFAKAIQINKFSSTFEDENLLLNINGIVQGEVKEITPNYTIKEKKIEVHIKPKQTFLRVLVGGELEYKPGYIRPIFKGNLMLQGKKGNILSFGYDNFQNYYAGYNVSILNLKR